MKSSTALVAGASYVSRSAYGQLKRDVDQLKLKGPRGEMPGLKQLLQVVNFKVAQFDVDFGDLGYRRTDNEVELRRPAKRGALAAKESAACSTCERRPGDGATFVLELLNWTDASVPTAALS